MKRILKPVVVWTLTSCLTTLQFANVAWAQAGTDLRTQNAPPKANYVRLMDLATPTILVAPQEGFNIDLGYTRAQMEYQIKDVIGKGESTQDNVDTRLAYGITPNVFVGAKYGYSSVKSKSDFAVLGLGSVSEDTSEGVGDPTLMVGGRINMGRMSIVPELEYQISTGNSERQMKSGQLTESNNKSGGSEITPSVSVFKNDKSDILFGGSIGYDFRLERKISSKDPSGFVSELKEKGGNSLNLSIFAETPQTTHSVGAVVAYSKKDSVTRESLKTVDVPGSELLMLTGYGNLRITPNISIIPAASYLYYMNDKIGETKLSNQNMYAGSANLRLMF